MSTVLKFPRPAPKSVDASCKLTINADGVITTKVSGADTNKKRHDLADALVIAQRELLERSRN